MRTRRSRGGARAVSVLSSSRTLGPTGAGLLAVEDGPALAELDIDAVAYRFGEERANLYEVEIGVKDPRFDLAPARATLLRRVPKLVPRPYNNLAVGRAIERALAEGSLTPAADATISPRDHEALARALAAERSRPRSGARPGCR